MSENTLYCSNGPRRWRRAVLSAQALLACLLFIPNAPSLAQPFIDGYYGFQELAIGTNGHISSSNFMLLSPTGSYINNTSVATATSISGSLPSLSSYYYSDTTNRLYISSYSQSLCILHLPGFADTYGGCITAYSYYRNNSSNYPFISEYSVQYSSSGAVPEPVLSGTASAPNYGRIPINPLNMTAEPVDTCSGAHVITKSLLTLHGAIPLEFQISYVSTCHAIDALGTGWAHNFEAWVQPMADGTLQLNWNANKNNIFSLQPGTGNSFRCADIPVIYDILSSNVDGTYTLTEKSQRQLRFDSAGRLASIVSPHGQPLDILYESTNYVPMQVVEPVSGESLSLMYSPSSELLTMVTDNSGRQITFSYNAASNLTSFTKTAGNVSQTYTFSYDMNGNVLSEWSPEGVQLFSDTYDTNERVIAQSDAVPGHSPYSFSYFEGSDFLITTVVDRTGATNRYVHDENYLLIGKSDAFTNTTSYSYETNGDLIAETNALGNGDEFNYDTNVAVQTE